MQYMSHRGFTLIEVMVVMFIIGIMATVTALKVNAPNFSRFITKVEQLSETFSVISDEAIYSQDYIKCNVSKNSISCQRYVDDDWQDIDMSKIVSWNWPENIEIKQILINGVLINDKQTVDFEPSGDNDTLAIEVSDGVYSAWIYGDLTGRFWVSS